jgi:non-specific serine/threonine protein kinase/serine/threonine-protein kinase
VLTALRKEPARRYPSAHDLAEDIRRYLEHLPVRARPDTVRYRAAKFAARHKAGVAAAALVVASLVAGTVSTARQARLAEARLADVRRLSGSFLFEFHDAIADVPGATRARQLVVQRAAEYLDRLARDAAGDVDLQRELATAYQRLGDAQGGVGMGHLGDVRGARGSYEKALAIRTALARKPGEARDVEALAHLEMKLSRLIGYMQDWERAEEVARRAVVRIEGLGTGSAVGDTRPRLASLHHQLGFIQARRGDEKGALQSLDRARAVALAYLEQRPGDAIVLATSARIRADLVERLLRTGDDQRASAMGAEGRAILDRLIAAEPGNARYRRDLVYLLNMASDAEERISGLAAANASRARAVEISEALLAAEPHNTGDRMLLSYAAQRLGYGLVRAGETRAGVERLRQSVRAAEDVARADPASAASRERLAEVRAELGLALHRTGGDRAEMCEALRGSLEWWELALREGRPIEDVSLDAIRAAVAGCATG